jgi:hypothetical protein
VLGFGGGGGGCVTLGSTVAGALDGTDAGGPTVAGGTRAGPPGGAAGGGCGLSLVAGGGGEVEVVGTVTATVGMTAPAGSTGSRSITRIAAAR